MDIIANIKFQKTTQNARRTVANLRTFWESNELNEKIETLEPGESLDINGTTGICIISDQTFTVTGDLNLDVNKILFVGNPLTLNIANPSSEEEDLSLIVYTW